MSDLPEVTITRRGNWADVVTSFTAGSPLPPDGRYEVVPVGWSSADDPAAVERAAREFVGYFMRTSTMFDRMKSKEIRTLAMDVADHMLRAAEGDTIG